MEDTYVSGNIDIEAASSTSEENIETIVNAEGVNTQLDSSNIVLVDKSIKKSNARPIEAVDSEGNVQTFNSIMSASTAYGIPQGEISACARGVKEVSSKGYKFRYIEDQSIEMVDITKTRMKPGYALEPVMELLPVVTDSVTGGATFGLRSSRTTTSRLSFGSNTNLGGNSSTIDRIYSSTDNLGEHESLHSEMKRKWAPKSVHSRKWNKIDVKLGHIDRKKWMPEIPEPTIQLQDFIVRPAIKEVSISKRRRASKGK